MYVCLILDEHENSVVMYCMYVRRTVQSYIRLQILIGVYGVHAGMLIFFKLLIILIHGLQSINLWNCCYKKPTTYASNLYFSGTVMFLGDAPGSLLWRHHRGS